jgi:gluconokinase
MQDRANIVVVIGPSGAGKSTVGARLASALGWAFIEGDDLHPAGNVAKMRASEPLTDADRAPWLDALRDRIEAQLAADEPAIIACSALKRAYRDRLRVDDARVRFVYLLADRPLLEARLSKRRGHFMSASMLESQLDALEPPTNAVTVDASRPVDDLVSELRHHFQSR